MVAEEFCRSPFARPYRDLVGHSVEQPVRMSILLAAEAAPASGIKAAVNAIILFS